MKKTIIEIIDPTSINKPPKRPLFEWVQSACKTTLLPASGPTKGGQGTPSDGSPSQLPMLFQITYKMPTVNLLSHYTCQNLQTNGIPKKNSCFEWKNPF